MAWRYWVRKADAANGLWIDSDAALSDVELTWEMNGPFSGRALIPYGAYGPNTPDLTSYWKRWGVMMYAEEDGVIKWGGICNAANPGPNGLELEFIGVMGFLSRVPYAENSAWWRINAHWLIFMLVDYKHWFSGRGAIPPISVTGAFSDATGMVGDPQPPPKPDKPKRKKDQKKSEYQDSPAYEAWEAAMEAWHNTYDSYAPYKIQWWNSPFLGGEIDKLVKAIGANYREEYAWVDKNARTVNNNIYIADLIATQRRDIKFEDGVNLAQRINAKDNTRPYFVHTYTIGSGEEQGTRRGEYSVPDLTRFYQGNWLPYRDVWDQGVLNYLARASAQTGNNPNPVIDNIIVWDLPDPAAPRVSSLNLGDIVQVKSANTLPAIDQWCRIMKIMRKPEQSNIAQLQFEITDAA